MSGHSKWSKIKRTKESADQKRGAAFTKFAHAITIAAKEGGDPNSNFKLRLAIDQAKAVNVPKENIERAIKRGTGELKGETIEEITYEGFGPAGIAFIIEAITDNKNRATANIKHILTKYGGSLGASGSTAWQFEKHGTIRVEKDGEAELKAIEAGAEDIKEKDEMLVVYTKPQELQKVKENLEKQGLKIEGAELEWVPKQTIKPEENIPPASPDGSRLPKPGTGGQAASGGRGKSQLQKLYDELDECEDVSDFYSNAEV